MWTARCHWQQELQPCPPWLGVGSVHRACRPQECCPPTPVPQACAGWSCEAPTLGVWLVTISAATQVLTSSALLKSCNRYLSCMQLGGNKLQVLADRGSELLALGGA